MTPQSSPIHIENTVLTAGQKDLAIQNAFKTYRSMKYDPVINGSITFLKSIISKNKFQVVSNKNSNTRQKALDRAINKALNNLDGYSQKRMLDSILSMLDYGCALAEVVMGQKDGFIVPTIISPIHLTTVNRFKFKKTSFIGVELSPAENDGLIDNVDANDKNIDAAKLMFFRLMPDQDFPLGQSLLYGSYTAWKQKQIISEYTTIGAAKNLSSVVELSAPSDYINSYFNDPASTNAIYLSSLMDEIELLHQGKRCVVMLPSDTTQQGQRMFDIKPIAGKESNSYDSNVIIERLNKEIVFSMQSTVLAMGSGTGGSFALSDNTTNLMALFIQNIIATIADEFKQLFKTIYKANGFDSEMCPELSFEDVQQIDLEEFSRSWQRLVQGGVVRANEELEKFVLEQMGAPEVNGVIKTETKPDESDRLSDKTK